MVREYKPEDFDAVVDMFIAMIKEVFPDSSDDRELYEEEIRKCAADPKQVILVDDRYTGFCMIRDDTEPWTPNIKRYNLTRVYIKPNMRSSFLYSRMLDKVKETFKDGDLIGMTEITSNHIPVLLKRQELIAMVFKLRRQ